MKKILIAALLAAVLLVVPGVFAQTTQEMAADAYCPKHPIAQCGIWALTGNISFEYTSTTATACTITYATPTLTVTIGGVTTTYDTTDALYDTYAELASETEAAHAGLDMVLGDNCRGDETCDIADITATTCLNTALDIPLTAIRTLGAKLYMANKRASIYRLIVNWTGTGACYVYVYKSSDPDSHADDTLVWQSTAAATTVDKDIDLHPYMLPGTSGGYLKVFVKSATTMTAGNLTVLGAYK
jgi:hypothetical protein